MKLISKKTKAMKKFDEQTLPIVRSDIEEALNAIAKKHGMTKLSIGTITYDPDGSNFRTRLEGMLPLSAAQKDIEDEREQDLFEMLEMPRDSRGKEITIDNRKFRIIGVNPKRPKYPVLIEDSQTGRKGKTTAYTAICALGVQKEKA